MAMFVLALPLLLSLLGFCTFTGSYRVMAVLPLTVLAAAYALDFYSFIQGGNLAGLFTMIAAIPALLVLLIAVIGQGFSRFRSHGDAPTAQQIEPANTGR